MRETFWDVRAIDSEGKVAYEKTHIYEQDAINDYGMVKRIFTDCTVRIEEWHS